MVAVFSPVIWGGDFTFITSCGALNLYSPANGSLKCPLWVPFDWYLPTYTNIVSAPMVPVFSPVIWGGDFTFITSCGALNLYSPANGSLKTHQIHVYSTLRYTTTIWALRRENLTVFGGLQTTQAQTSLRIRAVWSAPLLYAYWKVSYLDLLQAKFQFSS